MGGLPAGPAVVLRPEKQRLHPGCDLVAQLRDHVLVALDHRHAGPAHRRHGYPRLDPEDEHEGRRSVTGVVDAPMIDAGVPQDAGPLLPVLLWPDRATAGLAKTKHSLLPGGGPIQARPALGGLRGPVACQLHGLALGDRDHPGAGSRLPFDQLEPFALALRASCTC